MPVQTPDIEIGDALTAATVHQMHRTLRGYGWISGGAAEPGSGVEVEVPSGTTMWIDGSEVDVAVGENTAQLLPHDRWPRWASIVVNDVGEVEAVHGQTDRPLTVPNTEDPIEGRQAPRPAPPVITADDRVLHAMVWIPANSNAVDSAHIVDRRVDARVDAYNFTLEGYSDADAIAAIEAEDPLSLPSLSVSGTTTLDSETEITAPLLADDIVFDGSRETLITDNDDPRIYRTGNGTDSVHTGHGHLVIQPRTSLSQNVRILAGSPTPEIALEIDGSDHGVEIPNGGLAVVGDVIIGGNTAATRSWVDGNAVQNNTGTDYEIQKDGSDGAGVINFKTLSE